MFDKSLFKGALVGFSLVLILSPSCTGARQADGDEVRFPFVMPWDDAVKNVAADVSFLNATPAGAHGHIIAKDGRFVEAGTGNRIRFLGTNFTFHAAFPEHAAAEKTAAHLAKLGLNLVRFHHLDSSWGINRGASIWDAKYKDHQHIDPAQLDKLDYLIAQLKKNGIYVNLNLHVSRDFSEADGFPASVSRIRYAKGVDNFNQRMIALQKNYARDLLTHVNPYTGMPYTDDPVVAVVEINNENSLVQEGMNRQLTALPEPFLSELTQLWNEWLAEMDLPDKSAPIPAAPGCAQWSNWLNFLSNTERVYADDMVHFLKKVLRTQANIVDSQVGWGGNFGILRESKMDFVDNHAYWQHPVFPHKKWDLKDWSIPNTSMVTELARGGGGTLLKLSKYRIGGKPYSVSEYNHAAPNDYQSETVPIITTFGAYQDWDMICLFDYGDYGNQAAGENTQNFFHIGNNPAKAAFLPGAAVLFRSFAFPPANAIAAVSDSKDAGDFLAAQIQLTMPGVPPVSMPAANQETSSLTVAQSDRGGIYSALSPRAKAIVGFVGGQTINAQETSFAFSNFGNGFASILIVAMDQKRLADSKKILLAAVGRVENQDVVWDKTRTSVGDQFGHGPTLSEGIPAEVSLNNPFIHHVYALDGAGNRRLQVPCTNDGSCKFVMSPAYKTLWYEISE